MATSDTKIGIGNEANLQGALDSQLLDEGDLAITTNDQFYYINKNKELKRIKPRIDTYESIEDAVASINSDSFVSSKIGQPISIKNIDGIYDIYTIAESEDGTYTVKTKDINITSGGLTWVEF